MESQISELDVYDALLITFEEALADRSMKVSELEVSAFADTYPIGKVQFQEGKSNNQEVEK